MNRRKFMQVAGAVSATLLLNKQANAETTQKTNNPVGTQDNAHHQQTMKKYAQMTDGPKLKIAMLIYPGMFLQDLIGPLTMFESMMNREIYLVWKDKQPIGNLDPTHPTMIPVKATTTFEECPDDLDVLFVPGGVPGTFNMMEDKEVLDFLKQKAKTAKYITSVCTGSLILGAAGLLEGYKATSHWATVDALKELGAITTKARIVEDRNRITGGGVTAGLDFGLLLIARLRNQNYAEVVQLYLEYDPQPPFNAGSPDKAPQEVRMFLEEMFLELKETANKTAKKVFMKI